MTIHFLPTHHALIAESLIPPNRKRRARLEYPGKFEGFRVDAAAAAKAAGASTSGFQELCTRTDGVDSHDPYAPTSAGCSLSSLATINLSADQFATLGIRSPAGWAAPIPRMRGKTATAAPTRRPTRPRA